MKKFSFGPREVQDTTRTVLGTAVILSAMKALPK